MKRFLSILILIVISWVLLKGNSVSAVDEKLIINEIMYNPPSRNQWFEVYNPTPNEIIIKGGVSQDSWKIIDDKGEHYLATIPLQGEMRIKPYGYVVISSSALGFLKDYPEFNGTVIDSSFNLKETNYLTLIYGSNLSTSVIWSANLGGDGNDKSLEYTNGIYRESLTWGGTPGIINSVEGLPLPPAPSVIIPTPLTTPHDSNNPEIILDTGKVIINEIFLDKNKNDYWIELKNADNFSINLANWKLEIKSSKDIIDLPNSIIKPQEFLTLDSATNQFSLANSDSLVLKNNYGKIISKINFQEIPNGLSIAKLKNQSWKITTTPTFNKENVFTEAKDYHELTGSVIELGVNDDLTTNIGGLTSAFDQPTQQKQRLPIDFFIILVFIISVSLTIVFLIIKNKLIY